ncbi:MFS multidrug transporter [Diplocarpon rosae]|nr:MFS multidrug transporter [Diplocarpon rosae]
MAWRSIPSRKILSLNSNENDGEEEEPLLRTYVQPQFHSQVDPEITFQEAKPLSGIVFYFMAIHFLLAFTEIILVAPLVRLFENSLCLSHYGFPDGGVAEAMCKIHEVQAPLATIRGWKSTFDTIPVLLVAIPIGKLGDRLGRRKIMAMSLLGVAGSLTEIFIVCAFPRTFHLRLVWLSSAILLCGGGLNAASAFMWAMASQSIPSETRQAKHIFRRHITNLLCRSHSFYYIFSAFYIAELISSFVASVTLDISPWIPCGLAMGSVMLCQAILAIMPDPLMRSSPLYPVPDITLATGVPENSGDRAVQSLKKESVNGLVDALSNRNIQLIVPVFLVGIFRYAMLNVLIQYASVRFGLKISTGATFYTETAVVNIFLFLIIIPQLTSYVRLRYNLEAHVIDLFLVRTSVALMCIGCLAIGFAQKSTILPIGVSVYAAGFGSRVSALALISYWISDDAKASSYAAIVVLESLGHAVGDPLIQQIFAASLSLPPFWMATPFFVGAAFYGLAVMSSSLIRHEKMPVNNLESTLSFEENQDWQNNS